MSKSTSIPSGSSTGIGEQNVTTSLMKSVMELKTQTQGEKILCNIQTVCMEIAALMQVSIMRCATFSFLIFLRRGVGILQSE